MALLQGVLNTFVIVLSRVVGRIVDNAISGGRNQDGGGIGYFLWREFRADAGGARLAGRHKMIAALQKLALAHGESTLPKQIAAFGISGAIGHGLRVLLMSHPPLEERIAALRNSREI